MSIRAWVSAGLLAKWLARKTPLRKPNRGEGIVSRKPRPKSACDFLGLLYCFIVLLCIYVVSCPDVIIFPTFMVQYSLFVLKVPLNPKQTNTLYTDLYLQYIFSLHCFDTVGWVTGRASSLWKSLISNSQRFYLGRPLTSGLTWSDLGEKWAGGIKTEGISNHGTYSAFVALVYLCQFVLMRTE